MEARFVVALLPNGKCGLMYRVVDLQQDLVNKLDHSSSVLLLTGA